MKNQNMVRTIHPVSRTVVFAREEDAKRFIELYSDLFYHAKDKGAWNHNGYKSESVFPGGSTKVSFTMIKKDFDQIIESLELNEVIQNKVWHYKRGA